MSATARSSDATENAPARGAGTHAAPCRILRDLLGELDEREDDLPARAAILTGLGAAASIRSRYPDAIEHYQQALPIYREIGDRLGEAGALLGYGIALAPTGSASARGVLDDAARLYELLGRDEMAAAARARRDAATPA